MRHFVVFIEIILALIMVCAFLLLQVRVGEGGGSFTHRGVIC